MDLQTVQKQLQRLRELLSQPSTDVFWSTYRTSDEVIEDLVLIEKGIMNKDQNSIDKLLFLLLPTCDLQEISISSGWGYEFLDIAKALEIALDKIKE